MCRLYSNVRNYNNKNTEHANRKRVAKIIVFRQPKFRRSIIIIIKIRSGIVFDSWCPTDIVTEYVCFL